LQEVKVERVKVLDEGLEESGPLHMRNKDKTEKIKDMNAQ
jgi:hypothetical protein